MMNIINHLWQNTSIKGLIVAFIVLNVADGSITKALMGIGGTELSPIWRFILERSTATEFVMLKLFCAVLICFVLLLFSITYYKQIKRILFALVIGMAIVFTINVINLSAYFAGLLG